MTEEEFQQFLKGYEEMLKRQQAQQADDKRTEAAGNRGGASGLNTGTRRVQPGSGKPGELENAGTALPPPEYRKAYSEFTEELAKPRAPRQPR
jgi:hypothetical protein